MSETTVTPTVKLPPLPSLNVERNGITLSFVSTEVLRGDNKGSLFLAPVINKDNLLSTIIPWSGVDVVTSKINGFFRIISAGWWDEAIELSTNKDIGEVNQEKAREFFAQFASTFSARGESIKVLEEQLEEIVTLMSELDVASMDAVEFKTKFLEYTSEVKRIQNEIASKRREKKAGKE